MGSSTNLSKLEIHSEMDQITLRLLNLTQELILAKLKLEAFTKQGQICLAKSRYTMGGSQNVSSLQLPTDDWPDFDSKVKIERSECSRSEYNVRFNYFSLSQKDTKNEVEELQSELVRRHNAQDKKSDGEGGGHPVKDPIKWFGILVPNTLRQSQSSYSRAIEIAIECANLQSEINGVIARKKYLKRILVKTEQEN